MNKDDKEDKRLRWPRARRPRGAFEVRALRIGLLVCALAFPALALALSPSAPDATEQKPAVAAAPISPQVTPELTLEFEPTVPALPTEEPPPPPPPPPTETTVPPTTTGTATPSSTTSNPTTTAPKTSATTATSPTDKPEPAGGPTPPQNPAPPPTNRIARPYEAESSQNALLNNTRQGSCAPCSGQKKIRFIGTDENSSNGILEFNRVYAGQSGTATVQIIYENGSSGDRWSQVAVNGKSLGWLQFRRTGAWNSAVGAVKVELNLVAGDNKITFSNNKGPAPDLDRIIVTTAG